ncbi:hypothetical protein MMC29_000718 [Sticta canariensis]|nr:hypothetical protein [Sticta canariensis]
MDSTITVRPAQTVPQHLLHSSTISVGRGDQITFRHPAYPTFKNVLLRLPALDHPSGGIHHETARIACAIIAGNRWDGYFTEAIDGPRVETHSHGVLQKSNYFFHVPSAALNPEASDLEFFQYPIVPCFREWQFPHGNLPSSWINESRVTSNPSNSYCGSNLSVAVNLRDITCRMSDHQEATEMAHLCPRSEDRWFHDNDMQNYVNDPRKTGSGAVNDPSNVILLREDLHTAFDQLKFVFVPKSAINGDSTLITHLLVDSSELCRLYQNTQLHSIDGIPREFLLTRFAWSIFHFLEGFLQAGIPRALLISTGHRIVSSDECKLYTKQPVMRSRSESPKKRSRPESVLEADPADHEFTKSLQNRKRMRRIYSSPPPDTVSASTLASITSPNFLQLNSIDYWNEFPPNSRIPLMKHHFLEFERSRSDPQGSWAKETAWLATAFDRPLSRKDCSRFYAANGYELQDESDESLEALGEKTLS